MSLLSRSPQPSYPCAEVADHPGLLVVRRRYPDDHHRLLPGGESRPQLGLGESQGTRHS